MLKNLGRLVVRITLAGVVIGAAAAAIGVGVIVVSELLTRRRDDEAEEAFGTFDIGAGSVGATQELDEGFLSLLACPVCKTSIRREDDRLVCDNCGRRYPIRDGIPVMLIEEAEIAPSGGAASS